MDRGNRRGWRRVWGVLQVVDGGGPGKLASGTLPHKLGFIVVSRDMNSLAGLDGVDGVDKVSGREELETVWLVVGVPVPVGSTVLTSSRHLES